MCLITDLSSEISNISHCSVESCNIVRRRINNKFHDRVSAPLSNRPFRDHECPSSHLCHHPIIVIAINAKSPCWSLDNVIWHDSIVINPVTCIQFMLVLQRNIPCSPSYHFSSYLVSDITDIDW